MQEAFNAAQRDREISTVIDSPDGGPVSDSYDLFQQYTFNCATINY